MRKEAEEGDAEVFDDTDFYQEILRDVIQSKSGSTFVSHFYPCLPLAHTQFFFLIDLGAEAWEAARPRKIKKVVDTKASKGRKLRYEVHEKLQNFMVPVTSRGAWHEEQIDELFSSLMGKGFSDVAVPGLDAREGSEEPETVGLGGLRVF